jgi:short-subunit dehydrogenase
MESIRVDLSGTKVRATTIYPGFVKTEMTAKNKFYMPFLMELDDAVKVMTRGLDRGAKTIAYPLPLVAATRLLAAMPRKLYEPLAGRTRMF